MTHSFDINTYRNLLTEVMPVAIETEEEYERILKINGKRAISKAQAFRIE